MVIKIISGGQTGADRAGLDAAIDLRIDYGGAIPQGRRTEDGTLPERYNKMTELKTKSHPLRTENNVVDSNATLIFTFKKMGTGSALTLRLAQKHHKPCLHIDLSKYSDQEAIRMVMKWLSEVQPAILNIAGSRESASGIYGRVFNILKGVLRHGPRRIP
ncbi:MAG TPA: hypothetical protein DCP92_00040 [Nitrospiraceae bacterium]|jgi:hypothetical protein|nr:hypothetical protein [Nitrospiraceae bacterium]